MQMERSAPRDNGEFAFTRVELATVIALLGLLTLLIVTAQAKPRSRTYLATDLDNHRALLEAVAGFANDNGGQLPNPGWGTVQINWVSGTNFPAFLPASSGAFTNYEIYYPQQLASLTNGQLFPYIGKPRIYMCPADNPDSTLFYERAVFVCSYTWNAAVNGYGALLNATPSSYSLTQFRPDAILEWEADNLLPFFWNDFSEYPDEGISARHSPETLVGQFGGSVAQINVSSWYGNSLAGTQGSRGSTVSPLPNRLWCNPGKPNGLQ